MFIRPLSGLFLLLTLLLPQQTFAATPPERTPSAPERDRGEGPYQRLILRGGFTSVVKARRRLVRSIL